MKKVAILAGATAIAAGLTAPAFAQQEFATGANAVGISSINTGITDVQTDVRDDFARSEDARRFGPGETNQGLFGSVALTYTGRTGNVENHDFALAGRLSHNAGQFAQSVGILLEYGEDNAGDKDTEKTSVIYDGQYYFNDKVYAFALGRLTTDGLATDPAYENANNNLKRDAFFGVGPGYRIINNETTAWRVQAGVGIRYTQQVDFVENAAGERTNDYSLNSNTDTAYIISSRAYHKFNDQFFLTNDTDYLTSDVNDTITNELGLNFKMSDAFATRVSYKTEYVSDRKIRTDNTLGVSLVYGF